ncbi:hypothetical protein [Pseudarthrobacter sp. BIM B-2242]|nr:hypothetical protein [Pseudarthrobacter sp. BIM B-2242]QOD05754.1 hypothetical protein IDT60_22215 [Pseudarthrobacter sp. BIM B-2242]
MFAGVAVIEDTERNESPTVIGVGAAAITDMVLVQRKASPAEIGSPG